jgi:hypothetical protein
MSPPTIPGTLSPDRRTVQVRCPHCGQVHMHGSAGILDGRNNHRLSHCIDRAHADGPGYFITPPLANPAKSVRS